MSKPFDYIYQQRIKTWESGGASLESLKLHHTLKRVDAILNAYRCEFEKRGQTWIHYKRIPARYWHELKNSYEYLRSLSAKKSLFISSSQIDKVDLFIRVLPALVPFELCSGDKPIGSFKCFVYDNWRCLVRL